jgi:protein-tyrosine phosphatase
VKILFLCTANVCRSPLAEGYLFSQLKGDKDSPIQVASAGIMAFPGAPAFECSVHVGRTFGFDLSQHRARQFDLQMGQEADHILCMETWQAARVMNTHPGIADKVKLLGSYHPSAQRLLQINDPRTFTIADTIKTFELIRVSVDSILTKLA